MHLHTSVRPVSALPSTRRLATICVVAALATVSACGGDDESSADTAETRAASADVGTASATTATTMPAATAGESATSEGASGEAPVSAAPASAGNELPADICATVPSLEVLNGFVSPAEPLTTVQQLPRTPGEAICDVTGDAASNIQFSVLTEVTRESMVEVAANVGATIVDLADPALPNGFGYSAVAAVVVDETYYAVQVIDMDVIMDATNPQWIARSAELLKQWLPMIGVAP